MGRIKAAEDREVSAVWAESKFVHPKILAHAKVNDLFLRQWLIRSGNPQHAVYGRIRDGRRSSKSCGSRGGHSCILRAMLLHHGDGLFEGFRIVVSVLLCEICPCRLWQRQGFRVSVALAQPTTHGIHSVKIDPTVFVVVGCGFIPLDDFLNNRAELIDIIKLCLSQFDRSAKNKYAYRFTSANIGATGGVKICSKSTRIEPENG